MPPPPELVPFLALAKGSRGRAAADVVAKAIEAPAVHVFGELLDVPSVKEVRKEKKMMGKRETTIAFSFGRPPSSPLKPLFQKKQQLLPARLLRGPRPLPRPALHLRLRHLGRL